LEIYTKMVLRIIEWLKKSRTYTEEIRLCLPKLPLTTEAVAEGVAQAGEGTKAETPFRGDGG
jgi:hypothetical protein